jgi:ABC-type transporter Mla subunit MlaD
MGKQLKATIVGIFIIIGVVLFIFLYTWFSGKIGLRNTYDVVVFFEDVIGLRTGDPVMVYGLEKGKVKDLYLEQGRIRTILALDRDIIIPEDSKISIKSISYLGADRYVKIIPGVSDKTDSVYYGKCSDLDLEALASQLDSLVTAFKGFSLGDFDLNKIATNLTRDLNKSFTKIADAVDRPTEEIEMLAKRLDSLTILMTGDGTMGKLIKSDDLYEELRETNQALKSLLEDIEANPQKYINIKVF